MDMTDGSRGKNSRAVFLYPVSDVVVTTFVITIILVLPPSGRKEIYEF